MRGSITVCLTTCFTRLDAASLFYVLSTLELFVWSNPNQSKTVGQLFSDNSPYEISEYYQAQMWEILCQLKAKMNLGVSAPLLSLCHFYLYNPVRDNFPLEVLPTRFHLSLCRRSIDNLVCDSFKPSVFVSTSYSDSTGPDAINKFQSRIARLRWNKALWLAVQSHIAFYSALFQYSICLCPLT